MDEPDDDCVPAEELKIFHCNRVECGNCEGISRYDNALCKRRHARIVVRSSLIDNQTIRSRDATLDNARSNGIYSYDFFGRNMAVDVSLGPGPGGSPLGLAMDNEKANED